MENTGNRSGKIRGLVIVSAAYLIARMVLPSVRFGHIGVGWLVGLGVTSILIMMLLQLGLVMSVSELRLGAKQAGLWALVSAVVFAGLLAFKMFVRLKLSMPAAMLLESVHQFSLISLAVCLGVTISYIIREKSLLLPVVIIAALVDFWNVYVGPLGHVVATRPDIISKVVVQMPTPVPGMPVPMIGMGDFVFLALYMSVVCRLGMNIRGTFWWGYGLLTATILAVLRFDLPIPALVPMSVVIIIANRREFNLKREEVIATTVVSLLVATLLTASGIHTWRSAQKANAGRQHMQKITP